MEYGLTEKGFIAKPLHIILEEERAAYRKAFGDDIDLSNDSPDGAYVGNQAIKIAQLWELLEGLYAAGDIASAGGVYLDRLAAFVNVYRQTAAGTLVYAAVWGEPDTVIPARHLAKLVSGETFRLKKSVTITADSLLGFSFKVSNVIAGESYSFQIGSSIISYTAVDGDTAESIQASIAADLEDALPGVYLFQNTPEGIIVHSAEGIVPFAVGITDDKIEILSLGAFGEYEAEKPGPLFVPAGALSVIAANVAGLNAIINYASGITGRNAESDAELRVNLANRQKQAGGNEIAIQNEIAKLSGVRYAKVYSNRSAVVYLGRPPKSYEAVVMGGNDYEIAKAIFDCAPAGIEAFGKTIVTIKDDEGFPWEIGFSRPKNRYVWIRIGILRNAEEAFAVNGAAQIKTNIEDWGGKNLGVGSDLMYQRLNIPVFQVQGIAYADIKTAVTDDINPPADAEYAAENISIGEVEIALIDQSRITVVELTL